MTLHKLPEYFTTPNSTFLTSQKYLHKDASTLTETHFLPEMSHASGNF